MSSPYTGNSSATQAPAPAPGPASIPIVTLPADGDPLAASSIAQAHKVSADYIAYLMTSGVMQPFGDGSDGAATLDGSVAAPGWATKSGTVYTMTRDAFLSNLTVTGAGTRLFTAGYRLYVRGTLTTASSGQIDVWPGDAVAQTGIAASLGTIAAGGSGVNGNANASGTAGTGVTGSLGGSGGAGGTGNGTSGAGGGAATQLTANAGSPRVFSGATFGAAVSRTGTTFITGGGSGASGGGDVAGGTGGAGGCGGGVLAIAARNVVLANAANLSAKGGAGGPGSSGVGANTGGGGGGGGGVLLLVYATATVSVGTLNAATCCAGGAGGAKGSGGAGTNGIAGSNGSVLLLQLG